MKKKDETDSRRQTIALGNAWDFVCLVRPSLVWAAPGRTRLQSTAGGVGWEDGLDSLGLLEGRQAGRLASWLAGWLAGWRCLVSAPKFEWLGGRLVLGGVTKSKSPAIAVSVV